MTEAQVVRSRRRSGCLQRALAGRKAYAFSFLLVLLALTFTFSPGLRGGTRWREGSGSGKNNSRLQQPVDPRGELLRRFDSQNSCRSKNEMGALRKPSPYKPSSYLLQKLREYEALHRKCGPHTFSYNRTAALLKADPGWEATEPLECKYVVWSPRGGMGNRILSLASTFLYALLAGRVVLIDRETGFSDLMCEPFPGTSWLLPLDFPVQYLGSFDVGDPLSYSSLIRDKKIRRDVVDRPFPGSAAPLPFLFLNLAHNYLVHDSFFFCEEDQLFLREIPWLLLRSDNYFAPGLFLNELFEPELRFMFPEKEAVFHHLCRYLFHPSDKVWEMISDYYYSHLAQAAERVGIQIRVFDLAAAPFEVVLAQLLNCTLREKLLQNQQRKTRAVLVTSLYSGYLEGIQKVYAANPEGGLLTFLQPSAEGQQKFDNESHDMKAWVEMNLLGLADVLVTSAQSTFGYVGQALSGVKPWILVKPQGAIVPEPACVREVSLDPCFHSPPKYVCRENKMGDVSKVAPYVAHCMDVPAGIKMFDRRA